MFTGLRYDVSTGNRLELQGSNRSIRLIEIGHQVTLGTLEFASRQRSACHALGAYGVV